MGHTNSTAHYNLPQFLTSDKPAWLTDVNNAMSDIDAGMYAAQTKADTAYSDAGAAQGDATLALTNAAAADAKGAGACASIADTFDSTTVYNVGEKVIYNSLLYTCSVAVTTPGPWTGSTNWTRATVEGIIDGLAGQTIVYESGHPQTIWDHVEAVKLDLTTLFKVVTHPTSANITVAANGAVNVTANQLNIATPAGYTPIAIIGIYSNSNDIVFKNFDARATGGSSFGIARNVSSNAVTFMANVTIAYAKSTYIAS